MKNKFEVTLSSAINPDDCQREFVRPLIKEKRVSVCSLREARSVVLHFIDDNDLGGGNWNGGKVYEEGKVVAHVSYNGRVWEEEKWSKNCKEIKI